MAQGREWWRTGSSKLFNMLARVITHVTVSDTQCPLKIMNRRGREIMLATEEETWFFDLEFIALCERLGIGKVEVPVTWEEHRYPNRGSKVRALRDGFGAVVAMWRIRSRLPHQIARLQKGGVIPETKNF